METTTKICTKCKCEKQLSEFTNLKNSKDGKHSYCKICNRLVNKQSRLNNKEKIKIKKQKEYQENKEKILQQRKEYYSNNRENILKRVSNYTELNRQEINTKRREFRKENLEHMKSQDRKKYVKFREQILEDRKRYFKDNRDEIKQRQKNWYKTENGKMLIKNRNMKRRHKYNEGDVTTQQLKELFKNTKSCYWCNNKLVKGYIHVDHYEPLSKGGKHTISNLVLACRDCNLSKGSQDPLDFANKKGRLL
jgi:5-methylcytosine-specific restriction endonuclease McrA